METKKPKLNEIKNEIVCDKPSTIFYNLPMDLICYIIICFIIYGSFIIYESIELKQQFALNINKDIKFNGYFDLLDSVYYFVIIVLVNKVYRYYTEEFFNVRLSDKYKPEASLIKFKVANNSFKFLFYLSSSIFGYITIKDSIFCPKNMLCTGDYKNYISSGLDKIMNFEKPNGLILYYNLNLSFVFFDCYLMFLQPLQSDFLLMVIHHLATISLIVFSFVANYSGVGSVILLVLYWGDVLSTVVRTLIYLDVPEFYQASSTFLFLVNFAYTRAYVFAQICYWTIRYQQNVTEIELFLQSFIIFILILSMIWLVLITKKFILFLQTSKVEEIYKIKSSNKKQN